MSESALLRRRLRPAAHVHALAVPGQMVLLDLRSERYLLLDEVGAAMWQAIAAAPTLGDAIDPLLAQFEVERPELERDLLALVQTLQGRQLIELADDP